MTTEKNFWKQIKSNLPENCLTYRIESRTTKGIPWIWEGLPTKLQNNQTNEVPIKEPKKTSKVLS